jgi:hypothetical protein
MVTESVPGMEELEAVKPALNLHSNPRFIQYSSFTLHNKVQTQPYLKCYKVTKLKIS